MNHLKYADLYRQNRIPPALYETIKYKEDLSRRKETEALRLTKKTVARFSRNLDLPEEIKARHFNFTGDKICIGSKEDISREQNQQLLKILQDLKPWRKGPFSYFGTSIEAEWQSHLKWDRIMDHIRPDLKNKVIADVGCNNLYYIYRMLPYNPRYIIGMDPMERYFFHWFLNNSLVPCKEIGFELLGVEDLGLYDSFFDVVFFMGILYHRRHPLLALEMVNSSMKEEGLIILEAAGIKGEEPVCLFPEDTYMKARGYWFMPTAKALCNMMKKTNFMDIRVHDVTKTTICEQRRTPWVDTETLEDFLDPRDPEKTVEGYPAPYRFLISGKKKPRRKTWKIYDE